MTGGKYELGYKAGYKAGLGERPTGEWEETGLECFGDHQFFCSECRAEFWEGESFPDRARFCPECGARMEVEE